MRCSIQAFLFLGVISMISNSGCNRPPKDQGSPTPSNPAPAAASATPAGPSPGLLDPALAKEKAPEKFKVKFTTTKGNFVVEATREWSPNGVDRLYNLVKVGFFHDVAVFRVVSGFMAQFGIHGDPAVSAKWREANIQDDPVKQSNKRGFITFAKSSLPNSRSTQFFINFVNNSNLDSMGFSPIGQVVEGMPVVDTFFNQYAEEPSGQQSRIQREGNKFLKAQYPNLDYIKSAELLP
jgi:peptidyl-prolyl cis-trans isomerase A (cyclophilin A)